MGLRTPAAFRRYCIWQPATGYVADLYTPDMKVVSGPAWTAQYQQAADGSDYVQALGRTLDIPVTNPVAISQLKRMKRGGCPVRAFGIGWNKGASWLDLTAFDLLPIRPGLGGSVGELLRLRNTSYTAIVGDRVNLLAVFDWFGKRVVEQKDGAGAVIAGAYWLVGDNPDSEEIKWAVTGAGAAPTFDTLGRLTFTGTLTLSHDFPLGGMTLEAAFAEGAAPANVSSMSLSALDWAGAVLSSVNAPGALVLNDGTWSVRLQVATTGAVTMHLPSLIATNAGRYAGAVFPRVGSLVSDCEVRTAIAPAWA